MSVGRKAWICAIHGMTHDCAIPGLRTHDGRCLPVATCTGLRSEGWDRTNELHTHTARRPEERTRSYRHGWKRGFLPCYIVKAFDFIVATSLSVTSMLAITVMTTMRIHSRRGLSRESLANLYFAHSELRSPRTMEKSTYKGRPNTGNGYTHTVGKWRIWADNPLRAQQSTDCANPCFAPNIYNAMYIHIDLIPPPAAAEASQFMNIFQR